jgi:hypothetical protein
MNNLSKGLVIALVAFTMLSALMVASVSIPNAAAAGKPTPGNPPNPNAVSGCGKSVAGGQSAGPPYCTV